MALLLAGVFIYMIELEDKMFKSEPIPEELFLSAFGVANSTNAYVRENVFIADTIVTKRIIITDTLSNYVTRYAECEITEKRFKNLDELNKFVNRELQNNDQIISISPPYHGGSFDKYTLFYFK